MCYQYFSSHIYCATSMRLINFRNELQCSNDFEDTMMYTKSPSQYVILCKSVFIVVLTLLLVLFVEFLTLYLHLFCRSPVISRSISTRRKKSSDATFSEHTHAQVKKTILIKIYIAKSRHKRSAIVFIRFNISSGIWRIAA